MRPHQSGIPLDHDLTARMGPFSLRFATSNSPMAARSTLKILSSWNDGFAGMGHVLRCSAERYGRAWGHDFAYVEPPVTGRPPAWGKVRILLDAIRSGTHEWFMWIDADAMFVRDDVNIVDDLSVDRDLWMVNHRCIRGPVRRQPGLIRGGRLANLVFRKALFRRQDELQLLVERPNTGVMVFRANAWSIEFLESVWAEADLVEHRWWEQAAFHRVMGYNWELTQGRQPNRPVAEVMRHVGWLDEKWNSVPTSREGTFGNPVTMMAPDPVIVHFAGMQMDLRLEHMRRLVERLGL